MISAEAPVLLAKAIELFILDMTYRSWFFTDQNKRKTVQVHFFPLFTIYRLLPNFSFSKKSTISLLTGQKDDVVQCVQTDEKFDFLIDIVPRNETAANEYRSVRREAVLLVLTSRI
jgi:nuclear transcription factor Y gamma